MSDILEQLDRVERRYEDMIRSATSAMKAAADRIKTLEAAIKRQASASRALHASTLASVQHLKEQDRSEYFAAKALDSERAANAALTERVEALEAENARLRTVIYHNCVPNYMTNKEDTAVADECAQRIRALEATNE